MSIPSETLLQDLQKKTEFNREQAKQFLSLSMDQLNWRPKEDSWNILECLEHLNLYSDFYIPEISKCITNSKTSMFKNFTPGLLGDYFAKSMLPKDKLNKMKTFKSKNPIDSSLDSSTIKRFITYQEQTLELLNQAKKVNLNKIKTPTSISQWIRLKLGDTFRVVIYHNERHIVQAINLNSKNQF
ncbi:DinB family protein [Aquimarina sp. ERC-38]|uniref:DinB family protein n=1 Tax=Aquimarina sp. ERC-38 TaxID=2949996 RepID=UPI002245E75E|nr:DinB family protein [Aquimarina sp. ERC-38]UZO82398.1 DinB family protein [Aquimarina sp. ERC-38]